MAEIHLQVNSGSEVLREKDRKNNRYHQCDKELRKFVRANLYTLKGSIAEANVIGGYPLDLLKVSKQCVDTRMRRDTMAGIVKKGLGIGIFHDVEAYEDGHIWYRP